MAIGTGCCRQETGSRITALGMRINLGMAATSATFLDLPYRPRQMQKV